MTIVATFGHGKARAVTPSGGAGTLRFAMFDDFRAVEKDWRVLQSSGQTATPYQDYDFVKAWQDNVGMRIGAKPLAVAAYDADKHPVMVLPLVVRSFGPFRIAGFPGGKHSNFNMALWRSDFAAAATVADVTEIVSSIKRQNPTLDLLAFVQQPIAWHGTPNPFARLPHRGSTSECPMLTVDPKQPPASRYGGSLRRKLNAKERKLQAFPGYRYFVARTEAEVTRSLDAFFAIKPLRLAEQNIRNVFAEPGVEQFIRQACLSGIADGKPAIELHGLECESKIIAIFSGVGDGQRFSTMFNTYTMSEAIVRNSPGLVLLRNIIDYHAERGCSSFDFGIGIDDYKLQFCKERQPLIDSFLALTMKGHLAAAALPAVARAKATLKQSPAVTNGLRALVYRFRGA